MTDQALDLTAKQLQELADRLVQAQVRHDELQRLDAQVRLMGETPSAEAITPALMVRSPDIQGLQGAVLQTGREVTELAKRYGPKHPKMLAARSNLETLTAGLTKAVADAVTAVRRDLDAAATDLAQLEAELAARKAQAQEAGRHEAELRSLRRDLETDRQLYDTFLTRFKEAGQGVEGETAPARVIDPALVPARPVGPRIGVWVTIAVLLALVLGAVAVLVSEYLDNTVQSGEGLEESLGLMVLGSLPLLGRWRTRRVHPGADVPAAPQVRVRRGHPRHPCRPGAGWPGWGAADLAGDLQCAGRGPDHPGGEPCPGHGSAGSDPADRCRSAASGPGGQVRSGLRCPRPG